MFESDMRLYLMSTTAPPAAACSCGWLRTVMVTHDARCERFRVRLYCEGCGFVQHVADVDNRVSNLT